MKPDIKYITPYLPYKLHFMSKGKTYELNEVEIHNKEWPLWAITIWNEETLKYEPSINRENVDANTRGQGFKLEEIKPLLKPLDSLLTDCPEEIRDEFSIGGWSHFLDCVSLGLFDAFENIPAAAFMKMIELHYDVFQLIPQGLALDINTVVTK